MQYGNDKAPMKIVQAIILVISDCFDFIELRMCVSLIIACFSSFLFSISTCERICSSSCKSIFSIFYAIYSLDIFLSCSLILTRRTDTFFVEIPTIAPISS